MLLPLLIMVISIYICSYLVIVEPSYYIESIAGTDTLDVTSDFYAQPKSDGSYDIYLQGIFIENVETLEYYRKVPIIPAE